MAITSVKQGWSGESSAIESQDGVNGTQSELRFYTAYSDSPSVDDSLSVRFHPDIPKAGDPLPGNPSYICRNVEVSRQSPIFYHAKARYQVDTRDQNDPDPLNRPPVIRYRTVWETIDVDEDINGNPFVTANNEPIEGITMPVADLSVQITKNFLLFDPANIYLYNNTVNADTFLGFPPGVARIIDINAHTVPGNIAGFYWEASVEIQFRRPIRTTADRAWWKRVLHQGFMVWKDGKVSRARDPKTKREVIKPVLLDQNGVQSDVAFWLEFEQFPSMNFADLDLL